MPEKQFGYTGSPLAREESGRQQGVEKAEGVQELIARVSEITRRPLGELVITLDNGQVWVQKTADSHFRLSVGDEVRIEPAALRSFQMTGPQSKRSTRVTRLR